MSGLFGRIFSNVRGFYNEINSATLTGAIDVVITEQEDGTYACSPFHVRFGKMGVIRAREKLVDIEINGIPADIQMKLGEAGEAFFVQKVDEEIPAHLATSPIPSSMELMEKGIKEMKEATGTTISIPTVTMTTSTSQGETNFVSMDQSNDDFKSAMSILLKDVKSDSSLDENKEEEKKPLRKKVLKKKKIGGKSSPRVMSASVPEGDGIFDMEVSETSSEEGEVVKMAKSMSFPVIEYNADTTTMGWRKTSFVHPLSDPELSPICSPQATRPPSPVSDTEVDRQRVEEAQQSILLEDTATWEWGDFPKPPSSEMLSTLADKSDISKDNKDKNKSGKLFRLWKRESSMKQQEADGVYLDDLQLEDPEIAKLYLGSPRGFMSIRDRDDDCESGRGASLPQSPHSVDGAVGGPVSFLESEVRHLGHVSLSLCGGLSDPDGVNLEKFMQKVVTFGDLCEKPNMINDPDLVVRIHDKGYFNWPVAAPLLLCNVVFHKDLPEDSVKMLTKEHMPKKKKSGGSSWFPWRRTIPVDTTQEVSTSTMATLTTVQSSIESENLNKTTDSGLNVNTSVSGASSAPTSVHSTPRKEQKPKEESSLSPSEIDSEGSEEIGISQSSSTKIPELPPLNLDTIHRGESPPDVCKKSLRLTTEQIRKLNLRPGANEITFSVTTQYQGTTRCTSHVYLWRYDDKIVISDIDGTITKSDVLGQILPILGQDWTQCGITDLFTRIHRNGYKFIYLSARAIGQSKITKDLLKNIRQGELVLPDGPLLLNPASLISAFHREVIVKNPEEFKISCLKDVAALFPLSPFYAGFGNKINDVVAYRALKIPSFRIFTINHRGELTHDLSYKFRSSYTNLSEITDHFFPPLHLRHHTNEFSSVNYWRQPIPEVDCLEGEEVLKIENETK